MELKYPMLTKYIPYLKFAPYAVIAVLALLAGIQTMNARHWQKRYIGAEKALASTVAAYAGAQIAAAQINKAKVAQIEREYQIAGQKAEATHEKLIATNRANLAGWLRGQANKGSANSADTGRGATVPGEPLQGTDTAIIPISDLEIVADAYAQLDALRLWALDVGKVN